MDQLHFIGTAGWSIASRYKDRFRQSGSQLERYAEVLRAVEINSSFYRPHRRETYERWAASVPESFRFSVKVPKAITHERRLVDCEALFDEFLEQARGLGEKLGLLLVQLPPSLRFESAIAESFFAALRGRTSTAIACEPRHASWFASDADDLLASLRIARVAADPARQEGADRPGGWPGLVYMRLHGAPRVYYSDYSEGQLREIGQRMASFHEAGVEVWCIFDNTADGNALGNAIMLAAR